MIGLKIMDWFSVQFPMKQTILSASYIAGPIPFVLELERIMDPYFTKCPKDTIFFLAQMVKKKTF